MPTTQYPYRNKKPIQPTKPSATKRFVRALALLLLLLALLTGSVYGWQAWSNHSKVKALQAQIAANFQEGRGPGNRERFREVREQVDALPVAYQQEFRKGMRDMFQARMEQRMRDYLALDKEARRQELFKRIVEDEKRRAERDKRRKDREAELAKNGGTSGGQRGSGPGGQGGPGGNGQGGNGSGGNGPGGNGQGGGGPGGPGRGLAARLDNSTPQFRASMAQYVLDMNQARREMGLPPIRGGWRR